MPKYKLRAEGVSDVMELLKIIAHKMKSFNVKRIDDVIPDVEFEFETEFNIDAIQRIISTIIDGHVMLETVTLLEDYTGIRK